MTSTENIQSTKVVTSNRNAWTIQDAIKRLDAMKARYGTTPAAI